MIERLIEYSIRNRFLVLFLAAALTVAGVYAVLDTPVDAIPDLSENQVIVFTDWMGRSPREIEDQVSYPLARKLQGLAGVKAVRSSSEFNFSMITIIFDDNVDFYFARQRVTEKLSQSATFLPPGVAPYMAPDATALGQIFWYTVEPSEQHPLDQGKLWALNKFFIAPQLNAVPGVADVAVVGGMPLEYQIDVRPEDLRAYGISLGEVYAAVGRSNMPAGGGVIQKNNAEYVVRGVGWIRDKADIEQTVVKEIKGTPIYVKNVATVQLGPQYRRSVYEKNGNEVTGGAVLMRHGENPLNVTRLIKKKITELRPGLPEGVHIVAAYDRTRLITGAIHTLTEVMWHEMLIASLAILLILVHFRSVFVICVTLPLSVLFSFLLMWVLRKLGIVNVQADIMSLAGITISIGILVDQAIVMTENATHALKEHFGDKPVTGDIRELVVGPCRTVGRPIFFSVLIMLLSFIPVFMLSGREGKYFHPLAFTKSFAMIGVALISVTLVPALIPTFLKGRLRSEEENPIVRSFIQIYKPLLTWALPRWNLVMFFFAAILIAAAGIFPLQALLGWGASEVYWRIAFLCVYAAVTALTIAFTHGGRWQVLNFALLTLLALWAFRLPKIGVSYMPALDEGAALDMPVSVPRASITQVADDLKARDALLRGFPEVESVIGKAGRADTPTDPAPLEMVETFVNFRPKELWPKRTMRFDDALAHADRAVGELAGHGFFAAPDGAQRKALVNEVAQKAVERFDEQMRELASQRYEGFERDLEVRLTRHAVAEVVRQLADDGTLHWPADRKSEAEIERLTGQLTPKYGPWLARALALDDIQELAGDVAQDLASIGAVSDVTAALQLKQSIIGRVATATAEALGAEHPTFATRLFAEVEDRRVEMWHERVREINWELFDRGTELFNQYVVEETAKAAVAQSVLGDAEHHEDTKHFAAAVVAAQVGKPTDDAARAPFQPAIDALLPALRGSTFFWPRTGGPRGDLIDDEMKSRVLQVPGWSNIFTQPIINRIEMLSTGVRTDIGVKIFGPDLATIDRVSQQTADVLKTVAGAQDVVAAQIMGKGFLQIDIDRERAARYGISVADVQTEIETALGGRAVTYTVEERERFPVRLRYARAARDDEEAIRRLLIAPGSMSGPRPMPSNAADGGAMNETSALPPFTSGTSNGHTALPGHAARTARLIPLSAVADVRIVEGPAMIKAENGRLMNYVTLNVRRRDIVGFVDEAQRVVAQKVTLPEGVHIEWSGEFEHQLRAAKTLGFVFPIVIVLIFVILYLTYKDLADAALMMLAVPEALAGGAFFLYLFPKIIDGWNAPPVDFSVAVWVGFIACFGMATETGIIMLVYLREAIEKRGGLENIKSLEELRQAVIEGAVHRLRPKLLTEGVAIIAIFPMVFAKGIGGEILAPMALPVLGGLLVSDEVVDLFLPVRFYWIRRARWLKLHGHKPQLPASTESAPTPAVAK